MQIAALLLSLALVQTAASQASSFESLLERGRQALARGEWEAAQVAFKEASRLQPQDPEVWLYSGEVHARRGEFREAIVCFRRAVEYGPDEPGYVFRLAILYTELQRFHEAQTLLNDFLRRKPDHPQTYLLLGRVAEEQGAHAEAEEHLRHYVQLQPDDVRGLAELGVALLAQEKLQEAEPWLKQALEKDPSYGPAHYNLGVLYSRRGDDRQARHHLEEATRLLADDVKAHYQLGTVLVRLNDFAGAEKAFQRALQLAPDYAEAHYALGMLWQRLGRSEEARRALAEYERISAQALEERQRGRRVSAYHLEVRQLLEQDRLGEAESKLGEILALDPRNDLAHYRLAQIAYLRRAYEAALDNVRAAIRLKAFEPAYYLLEAICFERLGRDTEAAAGYERVLGLADYADAYLALGQMELRRQENRKAVALLRRAVELEPENPDFRLVLAEALEQAGDPVESQKQRAQAEALRTKPDPR